MIVHVLELIGAVLIGYGAGVATAIGLSRRRYFNDERDNDG